MKRYIYITTEFEGVHKYVDAPDEVSFLRHYHRHLFKVKLFISVNHNDRDLEFILVKREINTFIKETFYENNNLSCESIAEQILRFAKYKYGAQRHIVCEVNEDGENGAVLESEE